MSKSLSRQKRYDAAIEPITSVRSDVEELRDELQ